MSSRNEGIFFNVKRFDYEGGTQIRIYEKPLSHGSVRENKSKEKHEKNVLENKENIQNNEKNVLENKETNSNDEQNKSVIESANRAKQSVIGIARANKWDYFLTITFNPDKVDSTNYSEVTRKTTKWINNLKQRVAPNMKYLLVPELHEDGKKWHFHGLLADCEELAFVDSGIVKNGKVVYNLSNWKYGFSTVTRVEDTRRVSAYISKYLSKEMCNVTFGKKRYWASKNCIRSEEVMTHDFVDDTMEYIRQISDDIKWIKTFESNGQKVYYIEV